MKWGTLVGVFPVNKTTLEWYNRAVKKLELQIFSNPSSDLTLAASVYGKLNGANGHVVEEEDSKMEDVEDVKDKAGSAQLPPTSPTPGMEEGSQETNANADKLNAHLAPEDQPYPTKRVRKHSDTDTASLISICDFCHIACFML